MQRILCPVHEEETPSCVVYEDHWKCFGCGASGPLSQLGLEGARAVPQRPPVNLEEECARIAALPRASVRGLSLPVDDRGYYILWPCGGYYKHRLFFPRPGQKYIGPRGHKKPPFWARRDAGNKALFLVEGELNALSLAQAPSADGWDICSPGGVGDFKESLLPLFTSYTRFCLVLDKDQPGLDAGKKMKDMLVRLTPYVELRLVQPDLNELLQNERLQEEVRSWALPTK